MAKRSAESKAAIPQPADKFVELMLVAAEYTKSCGGIEQAKKALTDAGQFIDRAGSAANAAKSLNVLESLKDKIGD